MKLIDALELGKDCGLATVGEAVLNIDFHSSNLFSYSEIEEELSELYNEAHSYVTFVGKISDFIPEAINTIKKLERTI